MIPPWQNYPSGITDSPQHLDDQAYFQEKLRVDSERLFLPHKAILDVITAPPCGQGPIVSGKPRLARLKATVKLIFVFMCIRLPVKYIKGAEGYEKYIQVNTSFCTLGLKLMMSIDNESGNRILPPE